MQLEDIKQAIRYLRAHAEELRIDPDRIVVMGESAGGYLSGLVGLTGDRREFDVGQYQEYSSAVKGVVSFYPVTMPSQFAADPDLVPLSPDINCYLDLDRLVSEKSPPFMILHGTKDSQVPLSQSETLYEALREKNVRAELYIFEGAEHADAPFYQTEVKEKILEFIQSIC
jgi:acetyl esterase/lipase